MSCLCTFSCNSHELLLICVGYTRVSMGPLSHSKCATFYYRFWSWCSCPTGSFWCRTSRVGTWQCCISLHAMFNKFPGIVMWPASLSVLWRHLLSEVLLWTEFVTCEISGARPTKSLWCLLGKIRAHSTVFGWPSEQCCPISSLWCYWYELYAGLD